jgi:hypothetical protein
MVEKVRENRVRRMASRQGLVLRKTRRRDPRALDYGRYWLRDAVTGDAIAGDKNGLRLEDVEAFLVGTNG